MSKTFYVPSVEVLTPNVAEAYNYRRNKETLGVLFYTVSDNKWNVLDFMNNVEKKFDTEKQAKDFIRTSTPVEV